MGRTWAHGTQRKVLEQYSGAVNDDRRPPIRAGTAARWWGSGSGGGGGGSLNDTTARGARAFDVSGTLMVRRRRKESGEGRRRETREWEAVDGRR